MSLGRYEIVRVIASGGMGVVYAARDPQLGRMVALKMLRDDLAADEDFRRRFVRESRSAASLDHPNILPVFDAGEVDGVLYIATRLVNARDLRDVLVDEGEMTIQRALSIASQIAKALDFAHEHGTVHRDVKPANILVVPGRDGDPDHAYLIDFGITKQSRADHTITASGMFVGTPEYVAPEQASGAQVDARADQYALACVVHHCLAGSPPFVADNHIDVLHAHIYARPPRLGSLRAGIPASLEAAVLRALSKDREGRYATCRAFMAAARAGTGLAGSLTRPRLTVTLDPEPYRPPPAPPPTPRPRSIVIAAPKDPTPPPRRDPVRASRRASGLAITAIVIALLAGAGAAAATLLGGGAEDATVPTSTATATVPPTATAKAKPRPPARPRPIAPGAKPTTIDVDANDIETRKLIGYSVRLPANWTKVRTDAPSRPSSADLQRETEVATTTNADVSLRVLHLKGSQRDAQEYRAHEREEYGDRSRYEEKDFSEEVLNGATAYKYVFKYDSQSKQETRRAEVMLRLKQDVFVVIAGGYAEYDDLARLARDTALSIKLVDEPSGPAAPSDGTYEGYGTASDSSEPAIRMQFGPSGDTVDYEDGTCSGSLEPIDDDVDGDADTATYRENIGAASCADGGVWSIAVVSDSTLKATWKSSVVETTIEVELNRP